MPLHSGQDILDATGVDVAMDLADIVGRPAHEVLDQVAALEHCHLCHSGADLHRHEVPADRLTVAFAPTPLLERCLVEFTVRTNLDTAATATALLRATTRRLV